MDTTKYPHTLLDLKEHVSSFKELFLKLKKFEPKKHQPQLTIVAVRKNILCSNTHNCYAKIDIFCWKTTMHVFTCVQFSMRYLDRCRSSLSHKVAPVWFDVSKKRSKLKKTISLLGLVQFFSKKMSCKTTIHAWRSHASCFNYLEATEVRGFSS